MAKMYKQDGRTWSMLISTSSPLRNSESRSGTKCATCETGNEFEYILCRTSIPYHDRRPRLTDLDDVLKAGKMAKERTKTFSKGLN
jgi:hypothetical protein